MRSTGVRCLLVLGECWLVESIHRVGLEGGPGVTSGFVDLHPSTPAGTQHSTHSKRCERIHSGHVGGGSNRCLFQGF